MAIYTKEDFIPLTVVVNVAYHQSDPFGAVIFHNFRHYEAGFQRLRAKNESGCDQEVKSFVLIVPEVRFPQPPPDL